jgi:hypothetical protein
MQQPLQCLQVLDDCELALELLEKESDPQKFRLFWLAALAALRSVGHVLHNVDAVADPACRDAVNAAYARWRQDRGSHEIFWLFINAERNSVLKQADPSVYPIPHSLFLDPDVVYEVDFDIFAPMLRGPWEGEDCRDVVRRAIDWWHTELAILQAEAEADVRESKPVKG